MKKYNPDIQNRRSIRLKGYDYSKEGLYFITVCSHNEEGLFGKVVEGEMMMNEYAIIVEREIVKTPEIRKNIKIDEYVIMPNHVHFIIEIVNRNEGSGIMQSIENAGDSSNRANHRFAPTLKSHTIGAVVGQIKSITAKQINSLRQTPGMAVWQRNYYENIIRNEEAYIKVSEYMKNNPLKWIEDRYYL